MEIEKKPEILAPAGDTDSFLAAVAAGADAVYCGLKNFSARMEAENFSLTELAALTELAHARGVRVHVAVNNLLKAPELAQAGRLIDRLAQQVRPDALIVQDLGLPALARQAGFKGELHLSTLANGGTISGLPQILADIEAFAKEDPLFWQPAPLLVKLVQEGKNFDSLNKA